MLRAIAIAAIPLFLMLPTPVMRAETAPKPATLPTTPGISGAVARLFRLGGAGGGRSGKTSYIAAAVIELDLMMPPETVEAASYTAGEAMGRFVGGDSLTRLGATRGWNAAQETSAPHFGDWTRAFIHESKDGRYTAAHLSIGQAPFVYTLFGVGEEADPLTDLSDIANRLFGVIPLDRDPVPTTKYRTGGLWGMLPRLEHLLPGFVFEQEWVAVEGAAVVDEEGEVTRPWWQATFSARAMPSSIISWVSFSAITALGCRDDVADANPTAAVRWSACAGRRLAPDLESDLPR
jgi:hypothetical protein